MLPPTISNSHGRKDEAEVIKKIVDATLKSQWRDKQGREHKLTLNDILVVSPYNYQVSLLRTHLGDKARIGSADLFQGQESPLVLISL